MSKQLLLPESSMQTERWLVQLEVKGQQGHVMLGTHALPYAKVC